MIRFCILISLLLATLTMSPLLRADDEIDSLKKEINSLSHPDQFLKKIELLNQLAKLQLRSDPEKTRLYANRARALAENNDDINALAYSLHIIAKSHNQQTQFDSAIYYYNYTLSIKQKLDLQHDIAHIYGEMARTYSDMTDYDKALSYYDKAVNLIRIYGSATETASFLEDLALTHYNLKDYQGAILRYKESIKYLQEEGDQSWLSNTYSNIGLIYTKMKKFQEAAIYYKKASRLLKILGYDNKLAHTLHILGKLYYKANKYNLALDSFLKELKLCQNKLQDQSTAPIHTYIGQIYFDLKKFEKALHHYNTALDINKQSKDSSKIARSLSKLGNLYFKWEHLPKALSFYNQALQFTDPHQISYGKALLLNNIGLVYKSLNSYDKALLYCKQSLDMKFQLKDDQKTFYPITSIAEIYLKLNRFDEAIAALQKALKLAHQSKQTKLIKDAYFLLYQVYEASKNTDKALEYHIKYSNLKDSINKENNQKKLHELYIQYQKAKDEQDILRLRETNTLQMTLFIGFAAFTLLLLILLFSRYRSNQKANAMLSEKNRQIEQKQSDLEYTFAKLQHKELVLKETIATKDKFFSIIAHDLKNPLHAINLASELLKNKYQTINKKDLFDLVSNIYNAGTHLTSLLENLLQWARSQSGIMEFAPENINLKSLIDQNIFLNTAFANKKNIDLYSDLENDIFVFADENMIKAILRNLISNAIKFTPDNGIVKISAAVNNGMTLLSITDSGIGIKQEDIDKLFRIDVQHSTSGTAKEKGTGLGLILCKEFVEKHGGSIDVNSTIDKGSTFSVSLPNPRK